MIVPGPTEPAVGCRRGMRADQGRISRRAHDDLPSGVPQACDEIACDADCYVEELVGRCGTPPGLASSSSR